VKIKNLIYIFLACYAGSFLRFFINNNFITSVLGSFLLGFFISKRLRNSIEKILITGFFSCFTSFSGFIYFLYKFLDQGEMMRFFIFLNLIIIVNIFSMFFGYWIGRKNT